MESGKIRQEGEDCTWRGAWLETSRASDLRANGHPPLSNTCVESLNHVLTSGHLNVNDCVVPWTTEKGSDLAEKFGLKRKLNKCGQSDSSYRGTSQYHKRVMEEGMLGIRRKLRIGLSCDSYPIWLVCINKMTCTELTIMGFSSKTKLISHVMEMGFSRLFLSQILDDISVHCLITYTETMKIISETQFDVVLVSGRSPQQVQLQVLSYDGRVVLGCMETMFKERLRGGKPSSISSYGIELGTVR
jgi:hypothetical protein